MVNKRLSYELGLEAEEVAARYLLSIGYQVLHRRWKSKYGEIDIVAIDNDTLLFVEVKAKKQSFYEQEIVSLRQQRRNSKAALDFLGNNDVGKAVSIRFDCIVVTDKKIAQHIEDAWCIESK